MGFPYQGNPSLASSPGLDCSSIFIFPEAASSRIVAAGRLARADMPVGVCFSLLYAIPSSCPMDGAGATSRADVVASSAPSSRAILEASLVTIVGWFVARDTERLPNRKLSRSGWTPVSAWISTSSAVSPCGMAKPGTQPAQTKYFDNHPDFG